MSDTTAGRLWEAALGQIQLQVPRSTFETWFHDTTALSFENGALVVGTPTPFAAEYLERRMRHLVEQAVENVSKRPIHVQFSVATSRSNGDLPLGNDSNPEPVAESAASVPVPNMPCPRVNPGYNFDAFIVGESNRLAHAAALAVAMRPGLAYNPLFIYSDVGLGKTHLLHAIANEAARKGLSSIYVPTEQFTNDFISAIRSSTTEDFRQKYRSVQVLLLDDIQFIGGKEQTQEGFFHTFNHLHNAGRQIVITCDRPPSALSLLEDRLRSRFQGGLTVDIQPPGLETRLAILRYKSEKMRLSIPGEVLEAIASKVHNNIRELEGSLNRLVAFSQLTRAALTMELVPQALADLSIGSRRASPLPQEVLTAVAEHYQILPDLLSSKSREKKAVLARHIAMYFLRTEAQLSLQEIGRLLGDRDGDTVTHGLRKLEHLERIAPDIRRALLAITDRLHRTPVRPSLN